MELKKKMDWYGYLKFASGKFLDESKLERSELESIFNLNERIVSSFVFHSVPALYLLDYTTGNYLSMSKATKSILGEKAETFIQNGVSHAKEIYHKEDLKLFNNQVFPDRLELLRNAPRNEHSDLIFTYNYRLRNGWGGYTHLLQRNWFVKSDSQGNPLLSMGIVLNVDGFVASSPAVQTVARLTENADASLAHQIIFKKQYFHHDFDRLLSKREIEVLKWMSDGLTSREIADKMFVSEHTIITHRRNMHEKTGITNATALVTYGFREGYL